MSRHIQNFVVSVTLLAAGGHLEAHADVHFHLKNCSKYQVQFSTFNGADFLPIIPYKIGKLHGWDGKGGDAKAKRTACGFGENCKVGLYPENFDIEITSDHKVKSGHYLRITSIEKLYAPPVDPDLNDHKRSYPKLTFTISKHEEKCSDPVNDPHVVIPPKD